MHNDFECRTFIGRFQLTSRLAVKGFKRSKGQGRGQERQRAEKALSNSDDQQRNVIVTLSHAAKPVSPLLPVKVITFVKHGPFLRVFMTEVMSDTKSKARMGTVLT